MGKLSSVEKLDETLFTAVLHKDKHVLRYSLPDRRNTSYSLTTKRHELMLAVRCDSRNFSKDFCSKTCTDFLITYSCKYYHIYLYSV